MSNSNQLPALPPPIQTTETFLLECSRSNSIVDRDKIQNGEQNASWINETNNIEIKKGDQISIEMVALNLAQTDNGIEFSGENVILAGNVQKPFVDNKVVLEIGYYIQNNQTYSCNLPIELGAAINNKFDSNSLPTADMPISRINIQPKPDLSVGVISRGIYDGFGMGFGCKYNDLDVITGNRTFQRPVSGDAESFINCYRVAGYTEQDYITPLPVILPAGANPYSIILERNFVGMVGSIPPATPSSLCTYKTFLQWKDDGALLDEAFFGKVGMFVAIEDGEVVEGKIHLSKNAICDIRASTANGFLLDPLRVQLCFPRDADGVPNSGGLGVDPISSIAHIGRAICLTTPDIRYSDIFRSQGCLSWDQTKTGPNLQYGQDRQGSVSLNFSVMVHRAQSRPYYQT